MLQQLFDLPARLWLLGGAKYRASARLAGPAWTVPLADTLKTYGLTLEGRRTLTEALDVFRPRWHWRPDPLWQAWDVVYPPVQLLARGGDDCDGWAMAHAQAAAHVLGPQGWRVVIASYFADPWPLSHHVALAIDPQGGHWVLQPEPTEDQPADQPAIFGPYPSVDVAVATVASWYQAKACWWDVRTPQWESTGGT